MRGIDENDLRKIYSDSRNEEFRINLSEKPDFNEAFLSTGPHRFCFAVEPGIGT